MEKSSPLYLCLEIVRYILYDVPPPPKKNGGPASSCFQTVWVYSGRGSRPTLLNCGWVHVAYVLAPLASRYKLLTKSIIQIIKFSSEYRITYVIFVMAKQSSQRDPLLKREEKTTHTLPNCGVNYVYLQSSQGNRYG